MWRNRIKISPQKKLELSAWSVVKCYIEASALLLTERLQGVDEADTDGEAREASALLHGADAARRRGGKKIALP